jgi:hypothetical protein
MPTSEPSGGDDLEPLRLPNESLQAKEDTVLGSSWPSWVSTQILLTMFNALLIHSNLYILLAQAMANRPDDPGNGRMSMDSANGRYPDCYGS